MTHIDESIAALERHQAAVGLAREEFSRIWDAIPRDDFKDKLRVEMLCWHFFLAAKGLLK